MVPPAVDKVILLEIDECDNDDGLNARTVDIVERNNTCIIRSVTPMQ